VTKLTNPSVSPLALTTAVALAIVTSSPTAVAQQATSAQTSSLSWSRLEGADGCIGTSELARSVETLLGRSVFVSAAKADVSVEGRVAPLPSGGWRALIAMSDSDGKSLGEREIASEEPSCRSLDDAVALAIALMIDPDAALGGPPDRPPPAEPPKDPEVIVKDRPVYVPVPVDRPKQEPTGEPWRVAVRGGPLLGVGFLPTVGLGAHGAVIIEPPWLLAVEGSAAIYLPSEAELDGAVGDFQLAYVGVAVCPLTRRYDWFSLSLCVEVQLGRLWADGKSGDGAQWDDHQFIANLATRARAGARLFGPVVASLGFAGAIPLIRDSFEALDATGKTVELFRLSPVVALPDLALGLHFP